MRLPDFATKWIMRRCLRVLRRPADVVIRPDGETPYLYRWYIVRSRWMNVYLHRTVRSDQKNYLHDHPWHNVSILLDGGYVEWLIDRLIARGTGDVIFRRAKTAHRLETIPRYPATSLFITGPRIRQWGFYTEKGWVPFTDIVDPDDNYVRRAEYR